MFAVILNPLLLAGLLGVGLPVLAHLLSRRKFDVVEWGAMQFLDPSRKTRRRLRLEELLLLLIRMASVALVVLALCRISVSSGMFLGYRSAGSRDVVFVIDGSNSMGRSDGLTSLHDKAIRRAQTLLNTLQAGDTISIIDARDTAIRVVESPISDRELAHQMLTEIPPAAGAANLRRACEEAVAMLGRCSNASREVVVLTDRQRAGWSVADDVAWARFNEILNFPAVRPKVWVVDVSAGLGPVRQNVSTGRVDVSRDLTVPGFPVNFQVPIHNAGTAAVNVPVQVLVNGQRLAGMDSTVAVPAGSEAVFSRSIRFSNLGTNLVGVRVNLPNDAVEVDNAGFAAVQVTSAIPVLLVESSESSNRSRQNTFFAELALSAPENKSPWIIAKTVKAADLTQADLDDVAAVVLADVDQLPDGIPQALRAFCESGNGLFIALGSATTPQNFETLYQESGIVPQLKLTRTRSANPQSVVPTTVAPYSIEDGWLKRFKERKGAALMSAPFEQWWQVEYQESPAPALTDTEQEDSKTVQVAAGVQAKPVTVAQLTSGDPLLLQVPCGRGRVLLMTSNIDASWNALPTTPDYVPFLHEALFQMAAARISRNVGFGEPLLTVLPENVAGKDGVDLKFSLPFDLTEEALLSESDGEKVARLPATRLPGVYDLVDAANLDGKSLDSFVVNYDHAEDDPSEITQDDRERLIVNDRLTFVESFDSLQKEMYADESSSELWALLLWMFLGLLVVEVWMTRRLVLQGHVDPTE